MALPQHERVQICSTFEPEAIWDKFFPQWWQKNKRTSSSRPATSSPVILVTQRSPRSGWGQDTHSSRSRRLCSVKGHRRMHPQRGSDHTEPTADAKPWRREGPHWPAFRGATQSHRPDPEDGRWGQHSPPRDVPCAGVLTALGDLRALLQREAHSLRSNLQGSTNRALKCPCQLCEENLRNNLVFALACLSSQRHWRG